MAAALPLPSSLIGMSFAAISARKVAFMCAHTAFRSLHACSRASFGVIKPVHGKRLVLYHVGV